MSVPIIAIPQQCANPTERLMNAVRHFLANSNPLLASRHDISEAREDMREALEYAEASALATVREGRR